MLVITRRPAESILIRLAAGVDDALALKDLFAHGPIEIMFLGADGARFKMGITAPLELSIWRKNE